MRSLLNWFWSPDFWLPPGINWQDIEPSSDKVLKYPDYKDVVYAIPLAIAFIAMRYIVQQMFLIPFALWLRVGHPTKKSCVTLIPPKTDKELKNAYEKCKGKFSHKELEAVSKRTDLEIREIERWIRLTKSVERRRTKLTKFCECAWRAICYTVSFSIGILVLWDKLWLWNVKHCWYDYPHQSVGEDVRFYYLFGGGYYCSLLITQLFEPKRKDFWEMLLHHLVTILLIAFSWVCNLVRIGTLVLVLHDCVDIFLESAKVSKYANKEKLAEGIFTIFILLWIVTRLCFYPFYVLHSVIYDAPSILPTFNAFRMLTGLLIVLQILHVFWTYFILKIVFNILLKGKTEDARSCTESPSSDLSNEDSKPMPREMNISSTDKERLK